jgi:hypothetical protein
MPQLLHGQFICLAQRTQRAPSHFPLHFYRCFDVPSLRYTDLYRAEAFSMFHLFNTYAKIPPLASFHAGCDGNR